MWRERERGPHSLNERDKYQNKVHSNLMEERIRVNVTTQKSPTDQNLEAENILTDGNPYKTQGWILHIQSKQVLQWLPQYYYGQPYYQLCNSSK